MAIFYCYQSAYWFEVTRCAVTVRYLFFFCEHMRCVALDCALLVGPCNGCAISLSSAYIFGILVDGKKVYLSKGFLAPPDPIDHQPTWNLFVCDTADFVML